MASANETGSAGDASHTALPSTGVSYLKGANLHAGGQLLDTRGAVAPASAGLVYGFRAPAYVGAYLV